MYVLAVAFVISFAVAAIVAPKVILALRKLKIGQKILEIGPKWHMNKQNIPTMGGIIFIASSLIAMLAIAILIPGRRSFLAITVYLMSLTFGAIGFIDDYRKVKKKQNLGLTAIQKIILQVAVAALFIAVLHALGYVTNTIAIPFTKIVWTIPWVIYYIFMAFVIVGTVNAVNLTDGIDGLASGVTFIVMVFFAVTGVHLFNIGSDTAMIALASLACAVAGGLGGFLIYNFNPAKVFMGDTGSLFLGGLVAAMAFAVNLPIILIPVGLVYIIETLSVIMQVTYFKLTGGKRIFKMAPIHHHFEMCGYSERQIVIAAVIITLFTSALAFWGITLM
ncbi:MAG: phospho-N-acetylmuramoyl-pentapeptide-transferase [Clostridiales bacterium]|nr:phospho-N-acetylmuramoyl-pentapeptide-transferase [Clostridiales bacterium]